MTALSLAVSRARSVGEQTIALAETFADLGYFPEATFASVCRGGDVVGQNEVHRITNSCGWYMVPERSALARTFACAMGTAAFGSAARAARRLQSRCRC